MSSPSADARPNRARGFIWWLGLTLVLIGTGMLAYVAWELFGTTFLSRQKQADAVDSINREWRNGQPTAEVKSGTVNAVIRIPRFGKKYAVPVLEGTSETVLAGGFGHFPATAKPGQVGNYALAGHRVTHGEPLRQMPSLQVGDLVLVETQRTRYTYRLTSSGAGLVVPFTEGWVLDPLPTNPDVGEVQPKQQPDQRLITLTTCAELFRTDERMIAFGVLVKKEAVRR